MLTGVLQSYFSCKDGSLKIYTDIRLQIVLGLGHADIGHADIGHADISPILHFRIVWISNSHNDGMEIVSNIFSEAITISIV